MENSNILLNNVYNSETKEEFLDSLQAISEMLKETNRAQANDSMAISTDNYIRLTVLDSQISSFLYSYG